MFNPNNVYPNSRKAAEDCLLAIESNPFVTLFLPPQAGKSMSMAYLAELWWKKHKKHVYFLTGMADNNLKRQNIKNFSGSRVIMLDKYELRNGYDKMGVSYFKEKIPDQSIILIDESQIGMGDESLLAPSMISSFNERNCRIVTVSATPFEQFGVGIHLPQKIVCLPRKDLNSLYGYHGISEMLKSGQVTDIGRKTYLFNGTKQNHTFINALQEFKRAGGYFLVRISAKESKSFSKPLFDHLGIDVIEWNMLTAADVGDGSFLKQRPASPTVVVIKGFLRAGKDLPGKENVWGVWESSEGTISATVQGLVGRLCGYRTNKRTKIFANRKSLEWYRDFEHCPERLELPADKQQRICTRVETVVRVNGEKRGGKITDFQTEIYTATNIDDVLSRHGLSRKEVTLRFASKNMGAEFGRFKQILFGKAKPQGLRGGKPEFYVDDLFLTGTEKRIVAVLPSENRHSLMVDVLPLSAGMPSITQAAETVGSIFNLLSTSKRS